LCAYDYVNDDKPCPLNCLKTSKIGMKLIKLNQNILDALYNLEFKCKSESCDHKGKYIQAMKHN